ncbi:Rieske (2Fe-2S) protein [Burkholderia cepacia]|uniref:Rieske (2Fe-2S) protein n=1 Tax=Burkholderia cepacia TaxID=292 RepID=UPI00158E233F|nr:Rieske 2Fe-2S domain-containing protein [Burkholderia cepacia]
MSERIAIEVDGKRFLVAAECPHRKARMKYGAVTRPSQGRCVITCPLHFSRFDLDTGDVLDGPATQPLDVTP